MKLSLTFAALLMVVSGIGQDTLNTLNLENFLRHVSEHHPVSVVASNAVAQADQVIRLSKGAFDPSVFAGIDQKYFAGKTYYSTLSTGVKIPTRIGADLKVMADWNHGDYLNNQSRVPEDGLTYLGLEIPVGRGLFTDERRTQLKRAQVAYSQSVAERQLTVNALLYEAGKEFIAWQEQYAQLLLAQEGLNLARERLRQVRIAYLAGDRPAVDTVEAAAQYFNRMIEMDQRRLNVMNMRLSVEKYLWENGALPLQLEADVQPDTLLPVSPELVSPEVIEAHPALAVYDWKLKDLEFERRLKIEQLKPQLNFNYNLLQTPGDLVSANFSYTNYKWGASFYVPLLLRKERAALQITKIKIASTRQEYALKERELGVKLAQVNNVWSITWEQCQSALTASQRYADLARAERTLFETGESSLFLVNAREMSYLGARSKYLEYAAKTRKTSLEIRYSQGILGM